MATPEQRTSAARLAAHVSWAKTPVRAERTAPARAALEARFARQVDAADPRGLMSPEDRAKAIESARAAHYAKASRAGHAARWGNRKRPA